MGCAVGGHTGTILLLLFASLSETGCLIHSQLFKYFRLSMEELNKI